MYSKMAVLACCRVAQVWRWSSSVLRVAKKLSATALSQHVPADALLEAVLGQPTGVGPGQVLGAAVGMVDQAGQQDGVRPAPW